MIDAVRLVASMPLLLASGIGGRVGPHLFNAGAIVAGSKLRK